MLNHTIVPARDKEPAARLFAQLFGLAYTGIGQHFAPVKVNDTLTFLFDDATQVASHHYAFHVSDAEFDAIFRRVQEARLTYGSTPWSADDQSSMIGAAGAASTSELPIAIFSS
jgi:hypothetical protein